MTMVELVPVKREILIDERGDALRASWHAQERTIVLSQWRSDVCRATFRLSPGDAAQLAGFLVASLGEAAATPARSRGAGEGGSQFVELLARALRRVFPGRRDY